MFFTYIDTILSSLFEPTEICDLIKKHYILLYDITYLNMISEKFYDLSEQYNLYYSDVNYPYITQIYAEIHLLMHKISSSIRTSPLMPNIIESKYFNEYSKQAALQFIKNIDNMYYINTILINKLPNLSTTPFLKFYDTDLINVPEEKYETVSYEIHTFINHLKKKNNI
tara:strand:+ start:1322 stop:1828 length:507 start_codon:yes stop_codon:yes gene_type:complete